MQETQEIVGNYNAFDIPLDVIWNDIDYMNDFQSFTTDPARFPQNDTKAFIDHVHDMNKHYIPIVDCGISDQTY